MKNAPKNTGSILGIDIGSVSLSVVQMDFSGKILNHFYSPHKGNIQKALLSAQKALDLDLVYGIGCVSSSTKLNTNVVRKYNNQVAIIAATRKMCKDASSVLHIGAEKFMLIQFDDGGHYEFTKLNSSCAAGTGSFLDQQARRLNLEGIETLCQKALQNKDDIPDIASRCAVFAKTDLIHAQQRGFSIEAICESLCKGLAKNIADTVFSKHPPALPILITGGVSLNSAVIKHLEQLLETTLLRHKDAHLFGAIGAGLMLVKEKNKWSPKALTSLDEILLKEKTEKEYYYEALTLKLSNYPDFSSYHSRVFTCLHTAHPDKIEIDIYRKLPTTKNYTCFIGLDIGSTSTKAVLLDNNRKPLVGLYTYTAGNPLSAVKAIFEAIEDVQNKGGIYFDIKGVGTTGSGRSFVGKIIGADLILDEITTHARAAYELKPETDTIIEIGGQDAKFTLMHNGRVTFSQMNTVCAAGTGSFIEEQARKLGCSLNDYSSKAAFADAPMASDRCTVFMERDINQLRSKGYATNEILATALHSVTENYLQKVASEASIGKNVCFQGATARNKSLIAAFEQRLQQPIFVSKYCHLTGALGSALLLLEEKRTTTSFRGLEIYKENIPIRTENCDLCTNNCRISLASMSNETVAYGFMCGRDYETQKHVSKNKAGFDLLKERKKVMAIKSVKGLKHDITIGLPASLHLFEELPLWKRFFNNLSIRTISSELYKDSLKTGKNVAGAEFCAPIASNYGHALYLSKKADYIFLPVFLQNRDYSKEAERQYCYYTQFSASLIYTMKSNGIQEKCLSPLLNFSKGNLFVAHELLKCLKPILKSGINFFTVNNALNEALSFFAERKEKMVDLFKSNFSTDKDLSVVLMGRPYVVLSKVLNKGIPDIFNGLGIKTYYQDMIPSDEENLEEMNLMLKKIPWYFASKILETTKVVANTPNLYPVLVTAFKCSPDAFIIDYFKKILHEQNKPYLILQIDEHDSNVGYETRIEAAVRSFSNHASVSERPSIVDSQEIVPVLENKINDKILLFPDWDDMVSPLLVANLKRVGIDARLMYSDELIIRKSMAHNTGQCLPVNIIAQEFIEYVQKHNLPPENTLLWMFENKSSCNIRLYPQYIKNLLEQQGNGFEKANVYGGLLTHLEISVSVCYYAYFAYMLGGLFQAVACKIRPYELIEGATNRALKEIAVLLEQAFLGKTNIEKTVEAAVALFDEVPYEKGNKPKVALFGDIYVCDNNTMNQGLHRAIERAGGEVITIPYSDFYRLMEDNRIRLMINGGDYLRAAQMRLVSTFIKLIEEKYYRPFERFLGKRTVVNTRELEKKLSKFNINPFLSGESYYNILKIFHILEKYPDTKLFVQANPAFCCPSLVTEAMTSEIKRITGVRVVTLTYDGTNEYKNDVIIPYLQEEEVYDSKC
jgi:predicted CoA-substrate-specific enzyme activase